MDSFGERLSAAVGERGPLCVGIDPHGPSPWWQAVMHSAISFPRGGGSRFLQQRAQKASQA